MRRLLEELKRRKVYRVGVAYLVAAFVALQLAELAAGAFGLPSWFEPMVWVLCGLGFPLALVLAWAFDVTPEGVERTGPADPGEEAKARPSRIPLAAKGLVALGLLSGAAAGGWYLVGSGGESPEADAAPAERSIAVLPFENMGGEESEQFSQGVHDGLLTRLSNVSDLQVISRTSVVKYEDTELDLPAIADSLDVEWIVEGAVQQAGGQVQVNAQLIQAEEDAHQWAQTYQRELSPENVFAIQSELTKEIARSLEAELTTAEERRIERRPTENSRAYELYQEGRQHLQGRRPDSALLDFHRAIEEDSTYAKAWAGLAMGSVIGSRVPDSLLAVPEKAARRALKLSPELAEAHAGLGLVLMERREGPSALQEFKRALALRPSYSEGHLWMGRLLATLGRPEEALRHQRRSVELNPRSPSAQESLALAYLYNGEYEKALLQARRAKGVQTGGYTTNLPFLALIHLGRREGLLVEPPVGAPEDFSGEWFAEGYGIPEDSPAALGDRVLAHLLEGDTARARSLLNRLAPRADPLTRALAHAVFDEVDAAFQAWQEIEEWQPYSVCTIRYLYPRWLGPLRADPRFDELLREINVVWGLNPDGILPDSVDVSFTSESDG